jgi:hypothetical protein
MQTEASGIHSVVARLIMGNNNAADISAIGSAIRTPESLSASQQAAPKKMANVSRKAIADPEPNTAPSSTSSTTAVITR